MKKNPIIAVLATILVVLTGAFLFSAAASGGGGDHKTSICHRTASDTNPYVFETVDNNSLPAHLNNLPGHPAKFWKSDGTWRGVPHVAGDPKNDYIAESPDQCQNTTETTPPTTEPTTPPTTEPTTPPTTEPTTPPTTEPTTPPTTEPTTPPTTNPTPCAGSDCTPPPPPHNNPGPPHHSTPPAPPAPPVSINAGL